MKTAGIIAEYNPFHNGHQFHIEETKKRTGADYIVTVLSGSFVQRGAPALLNKYDRARIALLHGADLVFELPAVAALNSAEGFATGGISLLSGLGVVDCVSCGCESADKDLPLFWRVVSLLEEEPPEYRNALSGFLREGQSYPHARELAVRSCLEHDAETSASDSCQSAGSPFRLLSEPNNLLSLEYARAIRRLGNSMELCLIPRRESGHHDECLSGGYPSAAAIRNVLLAPDLSAGERTALTRSVPQDEIEFLLRAREENQFLRENDFSDLLFMALTQNRDHLDAFGPERSDLAHRVANRLEQYTDWSGFVELIKTKNQTYTAISRYLAQVLLGIRREDLLLAGTYHYAPYARLIGFRKEAAPLLKSIRQNADIPVLTRPAKECSTLGDAKRHLLDFDIQSSELYRQILQSRSGCRLRSELRREVPVV